jgi:hypothetical protein
VEIRSALLCDFATVREGLLHVLGGGITRMWRPVLPAPLGVSLALLIDLQPEEIGLLHHARLVVSSSDGESVAEADATLQPVPDPRLEPGEHLSTPVVIPLHNVLVPQHGRYDLVLTIDNDAAPVTLQVWVLHPDEKLLPPLSPPTPA